LPKRVDEKAQRERIRLAAIAVFAKRGLATTGLAHVARAAGMQRSTLYHYYEDKAALVRDLARSVLDGEEALFRAALEREGPARERILQVCRELADVLASRSELGRILVELWASEPRLVRAMLRRVRAGVAEIVRQGQKSGEIRAQLDADAAAALLVGLLDGLFIQHFLDPTEVVADRALRRTLVDSVERILSPV
jgi:TetR/AcrR family fatty acid metabolism transcriptional regulator